MGIMSGQPKWKMTSEMRPTGSIWCNGLSVKKPDSAAESSPHDCATNVRNTFEPVAMTRYARIKVIELMRSAEVFIEIIVVGTRKVCIIQL